MGKPTSEDAAKELGLSGLRFWQLSQQAVAGLVARCLKQPRFRGRMELGGEVAGVSQMKRRIQVPEREVASGRRPIELLKELPGRREPKAGAREVRRGRKARPAADAGADATGGRAGLGAAQG